MKECLLIPSRVRFGITLVIALMVISSPVVMMNNTALIAAAPFSAPSTIGQDGSDFTTQAALSSLTARPTNNIVNTNSFYDVVFLTATAGAIKFIQVTFPAGTIVPTSAIFNEAEGIGPGFISQVSGQTVTYTVNNAVNVPAGTKIRLEFANINNPLSPSANYKVTVTTRNAANAIIDGPTQSTAYTMKQIGVNAIANNAITTPKIANGAITSTKPAESFMKKVTIADTPSGNAVGWNPDGVTTSFTISPAPGITGSATEIIVLTGGTSAGDIASNCAYTATLTSFEHLFLTCEHPPGDGQSLRYLRLDIPTQTII